MTGKLDIVRVEHATAVVKYRTMQLEIRARKIQLLIVLISFATAVLAGIGGLALVLRM